MFSARSCVFKVIVSATSPRPFLKSNRTVVTACQPLSSTDRPRPCHAYIWRSLGRLFSHSEMPSVWYKLAQLIEYFHKSAEPLDEDGARPVPALLTRKLEDIDYVARHGPPFSLTDLVRYYLSDGQ